MTDNEMVCPKCGYKNRTPRPRCKNCGEALFAWAETKPAKRKKPLLQLLDWLIALVGVVFLLIVSVLASPLGQLLETRAWINLIPFLGMALVFVYFGAIFLLLPLYYLLIYLLGYDVTTGRVNEIIIKDADSDNYPQYFAIVSFTPEHALDSRPRLLTCRIYRNRFRENDNVTVHYALRNPDIMIIEGE